MKPKLVTLRDLPWLGISLAVTALTWTSVVWNLASPDGEPIPVAGWVSVGAGTVLILFNVALFFAQRVNWIRKFAYEHNGVDYFFERDAKVYRLEDVAEDQKTLLDKWRAYHQEDNDPTPVESRLQNTICLFRREGHWTPSLWSRQVCGLTTGNFCVVGQGGLDVRLTAHKHELSHVYLNRLYGRFVGENEAHGIFAAVDARDRR